MDPPRQTRSEGEQDPEDAAAAANLFADMHLGDQDAAADLFANLQRRGPGHPGNPRVQQPDAFRGQPDAFRGLPGLQGIPPQYQRPPRPPQGAAGPPDINSLAEDLRSLSNQVQMLRLDKDAMNTTIRNLGDENQTLRDQLDALRRQPPRNGGFDASRVRLPFQMP